MWRTSGSILAAVFLAACVTVNTSLLTDEYKAHPVPSTEVKVYFADDSVPEHVRVAILYAKGDDDLTDQAKMIDELRKAAGKLGANAIILRHIKEPGTGARVASAILGISADRKGEAIAVYIPSLDRRAKESKPKSGSVPRFMPGDRF